MPQQAQTDPWEQAAKNYQPSASKGSTSSDSGDADWKLWQQPDAPHSGYDTGDRIHSLQNMVDSAAQTEPIDTSSFGGFIGSVASDLGVGATRATLQPLVHPLDTLKGMGEMATSALNPKPMIQQGENIVQAFRKNPGGEAVAAIPQVALALAGEGKATGKEPLPALGDIVRPRPSPDIVPPEEMAARRLSQAVLPATKDASQFIQAAPQEVPNILDFAKRTNNPLKTQLEFSKAAQGSAQEARTFYEDQILKPNDKTVKTTGTGFGERQGEGPDTYASLSEIDKRVVEINKQLDKPALNVDDARRALASKTELQAEASKLREILHQNLSQATGIPPEEIANLRQRVGRSYELANDTDAAVTSRMQGEGRADQGPLHLSQIPSKLLNFARGGPTAIADRAFQRSIKNFPGEPQALPTLNPPAAVASPALRDPIWKGMEPIGHPPLQPLVPDQEGAMRVMSESRTPRIIEQARRTNAAREAEVAANARERELLDFSRQKQKQAATSRKTQ